jgi:hypothetical protein
MKLQRGTTGARGSTRQRKTREIDAMGFLARAKSWLQNNF